MKTTPLFLALLFASTLTFAQKRYLPGSIKLNSNETKQTEIFYEDWVLTPQKIQVKVNNETVEYSSEQIQYFEIPSLDLKYSSEMLTLNFVSKEPINKYSELFTETRNEKFFLRNILLSESLSLYSMIDSQERTRYFIRKNNDLIELINYEFLMAVNGKLIKKDNKDYVNQLSNMFSDEPQVLSIMPKYTQTDLINFTKKYLAAKKITPVDFTATKVDDSFIKLGLNLGIEGLQNAKYGFPKNNLSIGISSMYLMPHVNNNRFVLVEYYITPNFVYANNLQDVSPRINTANAYIGTFIGQHKLQGFVSAGVSFTTLAYTGLDVAGFKNRAKFPSINLGPNFGIAYNKMFVLEFSRTLLFLGGSGIATDPQIHFKYFPLAKRLRKK